MQKRYLLGLHYFLYYKAISFLIPFLPLHLATRNFDVGEIGLILSLGPFIMIFSQPLWGLWSDRLQASKKVLILLLIMSMLTVWGYYLAHSFLLTILAVSVFYFFQSPITPISDSLVLANLGADVANFGLYRLWGSIGFAIGVIFMGKVLENYSTIWIFISFVLIYFITLGNVFNFPDKNRQIKLPLNFFPDLKSLISNKNLIYFFLLGFLVQLPFGAYNSFFSLYFKSLGGDTSNLGWAWALAALSEVPVFFSAQKILSKYSHKHLLCFAAMIYGIRWIIQALIASPNYLLVLSLTQGLTYSVFYFAAVDYINLYTPVSLKTTGQTVFGAICFGLGPMSGSLLAGWLVKWYGYSFMFSFFGVICILTSIIYYKGKLGETSPIKLV
ncbi:MAG: hypothetical protein VR72_18455 [Clostridiaceae bacterium BRH_c20a]|nr:MAG: hypothetical protein VR72_18455 [Clostridiaceae bacterium BRH_c20a]